MNEETFNLEVAAKADFNELLNFSKENDGLVCNSKDEEFCIYTSRDEILDKFVAELEANGKQAFKYTNIPAEKFIEHLTGDSSVAAKCEQDGDAMGEWIMDLTHVANCINTFNGCENIWDEVLKVIDPRHTAPGKAACVVRFNKESGERIVVMYNE